MHLVCLYYRISYLCLWFINWILWIEFWQFIPGKYEMQRRENRCILKIKNAGPGDEAEYSCVVGNASTHCDLYVEGKFTIFLSGGGYCIILLLNKYAF